MSAVEQTCRGCGSLMPGSAVFCSGCGAPAGGPASSAGMPGALAQGPEFTAGQPTVFASPTRRMWSWVLETLASALIGAVASAAAVAVLAAGLMNGSLTTMAPLLLLAVGPQLVVTLWGVAMWVWEGRRGKRLGSVLVGIRTVAVPSLGTPGMGRVLLSRLVIGGIGLASVVLVYGLAGMLDLPTALTLSDHGYSMSAVAVSVVVLVLSNAGSYVVAASCRWGKGPYRQGWHERASGTTMVLARSREAAPSPVAGSAQPASPPAVPLPAVPLTAVPLTAVPLTAVPLPAVPLTVVPLTAVPTAMPSGAGADLMPRPLPAHDRASGRRLIADVPGFETAAEVVPAPAPEGVPVTSSTGRHSPSPQQPDEIEHTRISAPAPGRSGTIRLSFDTGEQVDVAGPGLIGRAPVAAYGERVHHLIPIDDPDRSVSKTHVAFGHDAGGLWVTDRGSTNGTRIVVRGEPVAPVGTEQVAYVPAGAVVEFGDRSFTVASV